MVGAERGDFAGAAGAEPGAYSHAAIVDVRRFVDDGVRGGRVGDRLPRAIGSRREILQRLRQHLVLQRRAAAVAIDEPPPMQRRVEHVANVERRLAERELDEDRGLRQLRSEAIHRGRGRSDRH